MKDLQEEKKVFNWNIKSRNGLLIWMQNRIYVPENKLRSRLIQKSYNVLLEGHHGEKNHRPRGGQTLLLAKYEIYH